MRGSTTPVRMRFARSDIAAELAGSIQAHSSSVRLGPNCPPTAPAPWQTEQRPARRISAAHPRSAQESTRLQDRELGRPSHRLCCASAARHQRDREEHTGSFRRSAMCHVVFPRAYLDVARDQEETISRSTSGPPVKGPPLTRIVCRSIPGLAMPIRSSFLVKEDGLRVRGLERRPHRSTRGPE